MNAQQKPFRLGTKESWGDTTCGYGLDPDPKCTEPATIHVGWLTEPFATSHTCDEHMVFIEANADREYETHTFGPNCGMPGSLWHHPYEDEDEGYCLFPAVDDASLLIEEPEPVLAATQPPGSAATPTTAATEHAAESQRSALGWVWRARWGWVWRWAS